MTHINGADHSRQQNALLYLEASVNIARQAEREGNNFRFAFSEGQQDWVELLYRTSVITICVMAERFGMTQADIRTMFAAARQAERFSK